MAFANRLEYYVLIARDLELLGADNYDEMNAEIIEVKKMINGFSRKLS